MRSMRPDPAIRVRRLRIPTAQGSIPALVLSPKAAPENAPGLLWLHGGGYVAGMKEMVHMSRAVELVKRFGAVVLSPGYRLALQAPYPAAMDDCYAALLYLRSHAAALGVRSDQLMVGGESAGGGLAAALCMYEKDIGGVSITYQMPLYPMIDNEDTETSRDNHAPVWNTSHNHYGWKHYLRSLRGQSVPCYAAPARREDYSGLPPAYTFVCTAEPFYAETMTFIRKLRAAGVEASVDVYPGLFHAFDMLTPFRKVSHQAAEAFDAHFAYAMNHYFAPQTR